MSMRLCCRRVATVIFSMAGQEQVVHDFDDVAVADGLIAAAPFLNSRTDTANAYQFVFDNLIDVSDLASVGRRASARLVLVCVSDGLPTGEGKRGGRGCSAERGGCYSCLGKCFIVPFLS